MKKKVSDLGMNKSNFHKITITGKAFDFLKEEEDLYSEKDIIPQV